MAKSNKKPKRASAVERADIAAIEAMEPWLRHPVARAAGELGELADQPPLRALCGAVVAAGLWRGDRRMARAGVQMAAAHLVATALKTRGKNRVDRTRPKALIEKGRYRMKKGKSQASALRSFPSGHTAGAVAVARAAARAYPEYRWPLYGAAGLMGALQVPRQAHFPTDVLAGMVVGLAAEKAVHLAGEWLEPMATEHAAGRIAPRVAGIAGLSRSPRRPALSAVRYGPSSPAAARANAPATP